MVVVTATVYRVDAVPASLKGASPVVAPYVADLPPAIASHLVRTAEKTATWSAPDGDRLGVSTALTRQGVRVAFTVEVGGQRIQGTVTLPRDRAGYAFALAPDGKTVLVELRASESPRVKA